MAITPITVDQRLVKRINQMALLRLVREESGLSRADLSTRSGLTRSTISDQGLLRQRMATNDALQVLQTRYMAPQFVED